MTPKRITDFLTTRGQYRIVAEPLHVADVTFEFDAVLVGPGDQGTLVLVVDAARTEMEGVRSRIEAFALTLNRRQISRPITVVALNCDSHNEFPLSLSDICRILAVPDEQHIDSALAPLLPLQLPQPIEARSSSEVMLRKKLETFQTGRKTTNMINTARESAEEVAALFRKSIATIASLEELAEHD